MAAVLLASVAAPAGALGASGATGESRASVAAAAGWRVLFQHHYGPAVDYSVYNVAVATSPANAWVLGGSDIAGGTGTVQYPVAAHWNGKAWRGVPLPAGLTSDIIAASAPAASDIWAVTWFGGWILHWNGVRWLVAKDLPGGGELTGVVATSPDNVWVFGGGGYIGGLGTWHYNGKTWREFKSGDAVGLEAGSALSARNIWAVGGNLSPSSAIDHFNGTRWQAVPAKAFSGLQFGSIRAFGARNVWVTAVALGATKQTAYLLHYNGASWTRFSVPWQIQLNDPVSDGHGGLWFTGYPFGPREQFLVHRSADGAWSRTYVTWFPQGLAHVPGTFSLLAVGWAHDLTGGSAVAAANGRV